MTLDAYEVYDGDRVLRFTGRMLGESSSFQSGKSRWAECRIYLTEGGSYIVETVGKSMLDGEHDRSRAQVCDTARGAVESLYQYDVDQVRYMTNLSRQAATAAGKNDEEFRRAFLTEEVA